ncbi:hypothetical protein IFM89_030925 [Coptis chinensis]|uniref:Uncharacterized protein n=1 Tax=Coptis chinensis TaxID=261450 RepID=A0A835LTG1_9MAGN|nr:hypothetical protein IFM89_030925 [Coptis chinensis]
MASSSNVPQWSVFDSVKTIPAKPETLMAEIEVNISSIEYAHATSFLEINSFSGETSTNSDEESMRKHHDERLADEAYKAGCAALASGKLDEALCSLKVALSKCPPDKVSAIGKLKSLITLTSQQLEKPVG